MTEPQVLAEGAAAQGRARSLPPAPRSEGDLPIARLLGETRALVLDRLRAGACSIAELAAELDLSEEAVRRHLRLLEQDDLVTSERQHDGGRGRPRSLYRLSNGGRRLYPDRSGQLANELWEYLEAEHGRQAVLGFLRWRRARQAARYAEELAELSEEAAPRAARLAELLSEDGFLARSDVVDADGGRTVLQLTQTHCAVQQVAAEHPEICAHEAAMFRDLLGARVSRRQTIAGGAAQCVCTVEAPRSARRASAPDPSSQHEPVQPDVPQPQEIRHGDAS